MKQLSLMEQMEKNQRLVHSFFLFALVAFVGMVAMVAPEVAYAQAGGSVSIQKADDILDQVKTWLFNIATVVCTIVIMWTGYRLWAGHVTPGDAAKIIGGAVLIAAAFQIANFFFSSGMGS